jgi:hypothetical protein
MTIGTNKGERHNNAIPENKISKKRSILTSSDLDIYRSLYEQTQARVKIQFNNIIFDPSTFISLALQFRP